MTLKEQDLDWQMRNNEKKRSRGESSPLWHIELFEKELRKWKTGKRDCILLFTNLTICKWKSKRRSCRCHYHVPNICIHLTFKPWKSNVFSFITIMQHKSEYEKNEKVSIDCFTQSMFSLQYCLNCYITDTSLFHEATETKELSDSESCFVSSEH